MNKRFPRRRAAACLALLAGLGAVGPLAGCDHRPSNVPRPSDPERNTPKPKTLPDTKAPEGSPASVPTP
ncbi:hypothetical protein [Ideonella sp.]|uniref:hypothetical protein n=1 Tax=Ideonella sp. TaxID=1929293 RepID=UPI0035AE54DC